MNTKSRLAPREEQVLNLVCEGYANIDISRDLGIKIQVVKNYIRNICIKLNIGLDDEHNKSKKRLLIFKRAYELGFSKVPIILYNIPYYEISTTKQLDDFVDTWIIEKFGLEM